MNISGAMRIFFLSLTLAFCGCGTQHIRFEDNPAGFDDLVYMLESNLKVYSNSGENTGEEPYQYAPFALIYTGQDDCELTIEAKLEEFLKGTDDKTNIVHEAEFQLRERLSLDAKDSVLARDYLFDPEAEVRLQEDEDDRSNVVVVRVGDATQDRTRYFHLKVPRRAELKDGRWYRLTLDCSSRYVRTRAKPQNNPDRSSRVTYEFYVSRSNTYIAFGIGMTLVVAFSALGL